MHNPRLSTGAVDGQLDEANQSVVVKGADKHAGIEERAAHFAYSFQALSVMRKEPALADWSFVVDFPNPLHQRVVKLNLSDYKTFFPSLFSLVPGFEADLICPPVLERGDGKYGQIIPFVR